MNKKKEPIISKKELHKLYWEQELSPKAIGIQLGVKSWAIGNLMAKYKIKRRSRSEACKLSHRMLPHRAEKSSHWKGGRTICNQGYVWITLKPEDDFYASMCFKTTRRRGSCHQIQEHRFVMAKYLGRCLLPTEQVHHINGIKTDNRIENLRLLSAIKFHKNLHPTIICPHCKKQFVLINGEPIASFF